jgi:tRNA 2-thiouridine synthesizing protein E
MMEVEYRSEPLSGSLTQEVRVIAGKEILVDNEGFLWTAEDWTGEVAKVLAADIGLEEINEDQWRIIEFLRRFYLHNGRAPMNRDLKAETGLSFMEMEALFPSGIRRGARRIAGLPNPKTCPG